MRKKRKEKNVLVELIAGTAKKIVKLKGKSKLTARSIAKEADCAVGTIYNCFKNIDELILRINGDTLLKMRDEFAIALTKKKKDQSVGQLMAKFYLNFARGNTSFWNLLFEYRYPEGKQLPDWYEEIVEGNFQLMENAIQAVLEESKRSHHKAKDKKLIRQSSRVIWASFHGIISLSLSGKLRLTPAVSPEKLCTSLFETYIKGLLK